MSTFAFPGHAGRSRASVSRTPRTKLARSRESRRCPRKGAESWPSWTDDLRLAIPGAGTVPIAEPLFWSDEADDHRYSTFRASKGGSQQ